MKTSITNLFAAGTMMAGWAWTQPASAGDYRVHEWGTFTTVGGSDGGLLPGLEVEEEPLPGFVLSLAGFAPADKRWAGDRYFRAYRARVDAITAGSAKTRVEEKSPGP